MAVFISVVIVVVVVVDNWTIMAYSGFSKIIEYINDGFSQLYYSYVLHDCPVLIVFCVIGEFWRGFLYIQCCFT